MNNVWRSIDLSHCHTVTLCDTTRVIKPVDGLKMHACFDTLFDCMMKFKADCSFLLGDTLAPNCMAALCLIF